MNSHEKSSCCAILAELEANPCFQMFDDPLDSLSMSGITRPIYFKYVKMEISHNLYKNVSEFIFDVRSIFRNARKSQSTNEYRIAAAKLLSEEFEELVAKRFITHNKYEINMLKVINALNDNMKIMKVPRTTHRRVNVPKAAVFTERLMAPSNEELQADLNILHYPNLIVQAGIFISKLQKDVVVFGPSILFHFSKMTNETKMELHKYVYKKLREIATSDES